MNKGDTFTLLDKRVFILIMWPYLAQMIYSVYNDYYIDVTQYYLTFFLSLIIFVFSTSRVRIDIRCKTENRKILRFIKYIFLFLFAFKIFQFFKVFNSGIGYDQIRNFYFNSEDRFSELYYNSKILLYLMFYVYPSILLFLFLNSIFKREKMFIWTSVFIFDGLFSAGRFNIYIMMICFFIFFKFSYRKLFTFAIPIIFLSGFIQLMRGDADFKLIDTWISIVHYHIVPIIIFNNGLDSSFIDNIIGNTLFSGYIYIAKPLIGSGLQWELIQDSLQHNWVPLVGTSKVYNAFGNILLFSYWDYLFVGPIIIAFLYSFFCRIRVDNRNPAKIMLVWLAMNIYFSSLKMKLFAPDALIFICLFIAIYPLTIKKGVIK